jgi:hypothetical protein
MLSHWRNTLFPIKRKSPSCVLLLAVKAQEELVRCGMSAYLLLVLPLMSINPQQQKKQKTNTTGPEEREVRVIVICLYLQATQYRYRVFSKKTRDKKASP